MPKVDETVLEQSELNKKFLSYASGGMIEMLTKTIKAGANIHSKDDYGNSALHLAAQYPYPNTFKLLVELGVSVTDVNRNGFSPLHIATKNYEHLEIMTHLLDHGADIDAKDKQGQTALFHCAKHGFIFGLGYLTKRGAQLSERDNKGGTVLHEAILKRNLECVRYLLDQGVDPLAERHDGRTPQQMAQMLSDPHFSEIIAPFVSMRHEQEKLESIIGSTSTHHVESVKF